MDQRTLVIGGRITTESKPVKLYTSSTVILPTVASVLVSMIIQFT